MNFFTYEGAEIVPEQLPSLALDGITVYHRELAFSAEALQMAFGDGREFRFEELETEPFAERFTLHEFVHDTGNSLVGSVNELENTEGLPTAVESIICKYIIAGGDVRCLNRKCLIFVQDNIPASDNVDTILEIFRSQRESLFSTRQSSILFSSSEGYPPQMRKIVKNACKTRNTKYSILEYYRALEVLFLNNILKKLNSDYPQDPKKSLENAMKSLERERAQLATLIESKNQINIARDINKLVEKKRMQGNLFCNQLFEKFGKDKEKPIIEDNGGWRGCWYIYQIRCSIAHAGTDNIVYEFFDDADDIVVDLNILLEEILLGCLGVSFCQ